MSKLSHFAANHPAIIGILIIALCAFGGLALSSLTTSLMAALSLPQIKILSVYPGASPEDVESDISKVIEDDLATLPGLKTIDSVSGSSLSVVTLTFQDGIDPWDKIEDVRYNLSRLRADLPEGLSGDPWAMIADDSMLPIMTFSVSNEDSERTYAYLNDVIIPRITQIPGVSGVLVTPNNEKNIKVKLRLDDLSQKGVNAIDVYQVLSASSSNMPLDESEYGERGVAFRYQGSYKSIDDIKNLVVGATSDNVVIRLSDVADVIVEGKETLENTIVNGENAFYVEVQKRAEGDITSITKRIRNMLDEVDKETQGALNIQILGDYSRITERSILTVIQSGVLGIIMAIAAIWLCLGDTKATIIIGVSIPLCLLFSMIMLALTGRTLNIMTLSGLVVALGMIVDASIVMLEQVYRYIGHRNFTVKQAIFRGSDEVVSSILASILTTVVVFIPIVTLPGIVGLLLSDVALTLIFSMVASFLVAIFVVPFLIRVLKKDNEKVVEHKRVNKAFAWMERRYKKVLSWALDNKYYMVVVSFVALLLSLLLIMNLGLTFLPSVDQNDFYISVKFPYTYTEEQTREEAKKIEEYLGTHEEVVNYNLNITRGKSILDETGRNIISMHVNIVPVGERSIKIQELIPIVQRDLTRLIPDGDIKVENGGFDHMLGYVSSGGGWGITLKGEDMDILYKTAEEIRDVLLENNQVMNATLSTSYDNTSVTFDMNHDSMSSLGVTSMEAGITSALMFRDMDVGAFRDTTNNERYNISVTSDAKDNPVTKDTLSKMKVKSITGNMVSFDNIGELKEEKSLTFINRKDRNRNISVNATLVSTDTAGVTGYMNDYFRKNPLPPGVERQDGGILELIGDSIPPLMRALIIAVFLVYVVMVIQFERFRQPFIIMGCIPFCLIGIILGLLLFGTPVSAMAILALVALSGTVVNNGIILVDYINLTRNRLRECNIKGLDASILDDPETDINGEEVRDTFLDKEWEHKTLRESVINAGASRIRPILMTVATTILGVIPMAFGRGEGSELYSPLGQAMFLGLFTSTLVTLVLIPILYYITETRRINKKAKGGSNEK